jgi:hypothetical protein
MFNKMFIYFIRTMALLLLASSAIAQAIYRNRSGLGLMTIIKINSLVAVPVIKSIHRGLLQFRNS